MNERNPFGLGFDIQGFLDTLKNAEEQGRKKESLPIVVESSEDTGIPSTKKEQNGQLIQIQNCLQFAIDIANQAGISWEDEQFAKEFVLEYLKASTQKDFVPELFALTYVQNFQEFSFNIDKDSIEKEKKSFLERINSIVIPELLKSNTEVPQHIQELILETNRYITELQKEISYTKKQIEDIENAINLDLTNLNQIKLENITKLEQDGILTKEMQKSTEQGQHEQQRIQALKDIILFIYENRKNALEKTKQELFECEYNRAIGSITLKQRLIDECKKSYEEQTGTVFSKIVKEIRKIFGV